jgi:hypothetical protein
LNIGAGFPHNRAMTELRDEPMLMRWTFTRGDAHIDVYRSGAETSTQIEVVAAGSMRAFRFADRRSVVAFHAGVEHALLETGWHLERFEPERRTGVDRRAQQRGIDRRGALSLVWSR